MENGSFHGRPNFEFLPDNQDKNRHYCNASNEDGRCFELESVDGSAVSSTQVLTHQLGVPVSGTLVTASTHVTKKVGIHCGTEL